jgi:hypothetical protein
LGMFVMVMKDQTVELAQHQDHDGRRRAS